MSASQQLTRIVSLVAELTRREALDQGPATIAELARAHGVTERQIASDIGTLTLLGDHSDADWLLSLSAWQQGDRVSVSSSGPFRRPIRFSPDEALGLQAALALDPGGADLARRFARFWETGLGQAAESAEESPLTLRERLVAACAECRELELAYVREGDEEPRPYRVEPHQVMEYQGREYVAAWARESAGWRHFRLDRILALAETGAAFARRADFEPVTAPEDVFRAEHGRWEPVRVRFSPTVARWLRERYPAHRDRPDGSVELEFRVANPDWVIRKVLAYGAEAEILEPARYRAAMRAELSTGAEV